MSESTPYTLRASGKNSDAYYQTTAAFTDQWLAEADASLQSPIRAFMSFQANEKMAGRSFAEYAFEMLVLGVLLREHAGHALDLPAGPAWLLTRLVETQDRFPLPGVEKPVKAMRGLIRGLAQQDEWPDDLPADEQLFPGRVSEMVDRLIAWLASAGWSAQAETLREWQRYLAWLDEQSAQAILALCLLMAEAFAEASEAAFSAYTRQADAFSQQQADCARWRYDAPLITRTRLEYHLGMMGSEILTRAYRQRYLAMPRKIVIMPDCLCAYSHRTQSDTGGACQAELTSLGGKCAGCTPGCKANIITRLGEKHGFEAYILPDDMRGLGVGACSKLSQVGVVGISCVLTNWDAGWLVNGAGVPCQGVLLDYAGCKSHWDRQGQATDVNLKQLLAVIGVAAHSSQTE